MPVSVCLCFQFSFSLTLVFLTQLAMAILGFFYSEQVIFSSLPAFPLCVF